jgi:hypothetical protein
MGHIVHKVRHAAHHSRQQSPLEVQSLTHVPMTDSMKDATPNDSPLVSIVLCTYNGSRFLVEQMDSLLAQTYSNVEIIAADDCSSDDSVAILSRYADRDPRIQIIVNQANLGFADNFARALHRSRGELIAPCDQDDIWLPNKLATLVAAINTRSMAYCDSTLIDERGRTLGYSLSQVVSMMSIDDPAPFAFGNCVSGHAMLFRRELLDHALPIPANFFHDWWLAAVAASMSGIEFCNKSLVLYRQHGGNVTNERFAQMLDEAGLNQNREREAVRADTSQAQSPRKRGQKLRYLRETEQRLASLARLPGTHQHFLSELQRLWGARESQWISLRLWRLMTRNKDRLLTLTTMSGAERSRYCADFLWGLRTKRLTRNRAYSSA